MEITIKATPEEVAELIKKVATAGTEATRIDIYNNVKSLLADRKQVQESLCRCTP